jgi:hypothetical protein
MICDNCVNKSARYVLLLPQDGGDFRTVEMGQNITFDHTVFCKADDV